MLAQLTATSDRICRNTTVCSPATEFEISPPTATSDRVCQRLSQCPSESTYEIDAPRGGSPYTVDRKCAMLSQCNMTFQFVSQQATATSDRTCGNCTESCPAGTFQMSSCTHDKDAECGTCSQCKAGKTWKIADCTDFVDTLCVPCTTACAEDQFISANCTVQRDTECQFYKDCISGAEYEQQPGTATTDRICAAISKCGVLQYQAVAPTATTDRVCIAYEPCTGAEWRVAAATAVSPDICRTYSPPCNNTAASPNATFQATAPTRTSDRVCKPLTMCNFPLQYQQLAATLSSDRICANTTQCRSTEEYEARAPTPTSDRNCKGATTCVALQQYQVVPLTLTTDRICANCSCSIFATCVQVANAAAATILNSINSSAPTGVIPGVERSCNGSAGVRWQPAVNTTHQCVCSRGYAGDGFYCALDSDNDGYPNTRISECSGECEYCNQDICPNNPAASRVSVLTFQPASQSIFTFPIPGYDAAPSWSLSQTSQSSVTAVQRANSTATALVTTNSFATSVMSANISVASLTGDNFVGWIFGFKNSTSFYVVQWKRTDQSASDWDNPSNWQLGPNMTGSPLTVVSPATNNTSKQFRAKAGLQIKRVSGPIADFALWSTDELSQADDPVRYQVIE